jgi:hypothetical protein
MPYFVVDNAMRIVSSAGMREEVQTARAHAISMVREGVARRGAARVRR